MWPSILRRVPNATLCAFYGWKDWEFWAARDPSKYGLKRRILALLDQPGILAGNLRIEPQELWNQFRQAGVWLYPTECEETSCMNAMKAQAAGALPIVTGVGALPETVQWGTVIAAKDIYTNAAAQAAFVDAVEEHLLSPDETQRERMMQWALEQFNWRGVAATWNRELLT